MVNYKSAVPAFHYQLWITIGNDYISAFFVFLSFFLAFKWFSRIFNDQKTNLNLGELDLYLWYEETGKILK